jgi:thiol-disulfide isomerase/thioredoxin
MFTRFVQALIGISLASAPRLGAADTARATLIPRAERQIAERIELKDDAKRIIDLDSYRGHVVLLDFWATWCGGCKQELPWFQEFQTKYGRRKFAVIAVSMDQEGWRVVKPFVRSLKIGFKVVLDDGDMAKRYSLRELPAAFLIDRDGRVAAKYLGLVDRDNIESNIRLLLAEK